ncbi:MAG: hypothetical protein HZC12_02795 [Nitrospirae bacterium]|nr:hypothetical protein [Nitrospirota bacterium]
MENREEVYDEINLMDYIMDYINVIKKHRTMIVIIIAVSVLTTGMVSFLMPKIYEAKAVITPVTQPKEPGGMSVIAAQFSIAAPASSNVSEIVNLLKSNILLEKIITRYDLLKVFFKEGFPEGPSKDKIIWGGIRYLKGIMEVKHNQRENIIELSVKFKDPRVAADIINYTLIELTDHMTGEAKRVAETNKKYLESLIDKNSDPFIRQKVYALIAQQIETSMMAEVKENFAFKVLDPARVPDTKIEPKIKKNIMLSFVTSLFIGIFLAFFKEYLEKNGKQG